MAAQREAALDPHAGALIGPEAPPAPRRLATARALLPWLAALAGHASAAAIVAVFSLRTPEPVAATEPTALVVALVAPEPPPAPTEPSMLEKEATEENAAEESPAPTVDAASRLAVSPAQRDLELLWAPNGAVEAAPLPEDARKALAGRALGPQPCLDADPTDEAAADCSFTDDPRAFAVADAIDPQATFDPLLGATGTERIVAQLRAGNARYAARRNARGQLWDPRLPTADDTLMVMRDFRLSNSDSMRDKLPPTNPDPYFGQ